MIARWQGVEGAGRNGREPDGGRAVGSGEPDGRGGRGDGRDRRTR